MIYLSTINDVPDHKGLIKSLQECMSRGIPITEPEEVLYKLQYDNQAAKENLINNYGIVNPNSSKQVIETFKNIDDAVITRVCCDNGKWSTAAENLQTLIPLGYDIAYQLSVYRKTNSYIKYIKSFSEARDSDGRVHPSIEAGKTNRINYSNPPLMNMPKQLLGHVLAPRNPGGKLVSIDIKNQEPWILVNMLNITEIKELIELGMDYAGLYEIVFEEWYKKSPTAKELSEFKVNWNALTYGCSKKSVYASCKNIDPDILCKEFSSINSIKAYQKECNSKGFSNKRECVSMFGTVMRCDGNTGMALGRQHMDWKLQGTGTDILAFLVGHFNDTLAVDYEDHIELYYTRNDELVLEVSHTLMSTMGESRVINMLREEFSHQIDDWVPFKVEVKLLEPKELFFDYQAEED